MRGSSDRRSDTTFGLGRSRKVALAVALVLVALAALVPDPARGAVDGADRRSPDGVWRALDVLPQASRPEAIAYNRPDRFEAVVLDHEAMRTLLAAAPMEFTAAAGARAVIITLPAPDGSWARFAVVESPVMHPDLAAKFPEIKTYAGRGIDDPAATVRLDLTQLGFHAQVLAPGGRWYIDPYYHLDTSVYISFFSADLTDPGTRDLTERIDPSYAEAVERFHAEQELRPQPVQRTSGASLRTHRLAMAATGEFTQFFGGSVANGLAGVTTGVNRLTGIFEVELAIRLQLVATNNLIIYTNPATDPYTPGSDTVDINAENQANVDAVIGDANYDIGHVVHTTGGGYVTGAMGQAGTKALGNTGINPPQGDAFWVDFTAHEIGHQYTGSHTWNGDQGNCSPGQWIQNRAMEPGSGSTIMAYAGICGSDNLQVAPINNPGGTAPQGASHSYFHAASHDQIVNWTTGGNPGDVGAAASGNSVPTANAGGDVSFPAQTPFRLVGQGTDPNAGDVLTYHWEQYDAGLQQQRSLTNPDIQNGPLFRSLPPTASAERYLPDLAQIAAGATNAVTGNCPALPGGLDCFSEFLPTNTGLTGNRTMTFRLTVRDNRAPGAGGVNNDDVNVTIVDNTGPFLVTAPNTAVNWTGGTMQNVTWNPAGTGAAPINAGAVNIRLSIDGGATFPITLEANTPNDGAEMVLVPNYNTAQARVMVESTSNAACFTNPAGCHWFFDTSDVNFTINANAPGDFNGDGQSELVWRKPGSGENVIWVMNGTTFSQAASLPGVPAPWLMTATADFDGNNTPDLVWRNPTDGQNTIWTMNGAAFMANNPLGPLAGAEWVIGTAGDFSGDNQADLLWRNQITGQNVMWQMNGVVFQQTIPVSQVVDTTWVIVGSGDFNADGQQDLIWRKTDTNQVLLWLMNGAIFSSAVNWGVVPGEWQYGGTGDYNRDGATDIVWRNTTNGQNLAWLMNPLNGQQFLRVFVFSSVADLGWSIVGP